MSFGRCSSMKVMYNSDVSFNNIIRNLINSQFLILIFARCCNKLLIKEKQKIINKVTNYNYL